MNSEYFVLKPRGNNTYAKASRIAMLRYAHEIQHVDPKLACKIQEWVNEEILNAQPRGSEPGLVTEELNLINEGYDAPPLPWDWNPIDLNWDKKNNG